MEKVFNLDLSKVASPEIVKQVEEILLAVPKEESKKAITFDKYEQAIKDWGRQFQHNEQLIIRVSEKQKDKMLAYCKQKEITMSSFIRCLIEMALADIEGEE